MEKPKLTVSRGPDGFGSQFLSIVSGIAYAKRYNLEYLHTPLQQIKLADKPFAQNLELDRANKLIEQILKNLNIKTRTNENCKMALHFHDVIRTEGCGYFYNEELFKILQDAYPKETYPIEFKNKHIIAIHIRRGSDITKQSEPTRWIDSNIYDDLINELINIYPNSEIHTFSWNDPNLKERKQLIKHVVNSGERFIDDFNMLVHSDILVVGSSSFSMVAGMFNKNIVICDEIIHQVTNPIPPNWINNFKEIFKGK